MSVYYYTIPPSGGNFLHRFDVGEMTVSTLLYRLHMHYYCTLEEPRSQPTAQLQYIIHMYKYMVQYSIHMYYVGIV